MIIRTPNTCTESIHMLSAHSGPTIPLPVQDLSVPFITAFSATVTWLIPLITYTPEQYTVHYGYSNTSLNMSSSVAEGSEDIATMNQIHAVMLSDLQPSRSYFYQVESTNLFGTSQSNIQQFTTSTLGKHTCNI